MGSWSPVTLMSLEWQGDDYRLVLIEYTPRPPSNEIYPPYLRLHRSDRGPEGPPQIGVDPRLFVSGARLSAAAVAPLLARVRAAVHLEIAVFPDQGNYLGLSHGAMTHHFHMRLADEQSRGMEGSYEAWATAGYGQGWTARMAIAERAVAKFLASPAIRSQLAPIGLDDPAVRTLFSYVFWQTMGRAALDLRLQILSMAAQLGEPQHVPGLVDILRSTALRDEERPDPRRDRRDHRLRPPPRRGPQAYAGPGGRRNAGRLRSFAVRVSSVGERDAARPTSRRPAQGRVSAAVPMTSMTRAGVSPRAPPALIPGP